MNKYLLFSIVRMPKNVEKEKKNISWFHPIDWHSNVSYGKKFNKSGCFQKRNKRIKSK